FTGLSGFHRGFSGAKNNSRGVVTTLKLYDNVYPRPCPYPSLEMCKDARTMNPLVLKAILSSGLLSFPVTDFDQQGDFSRSGYIKRLEWLAPYGAKALFAAGGTGEFFSLTPQEYPEVIRTAVDTCAGQVPILAGVG